MKKEVSRSQSEFAQAVYQLVRVIPRGKVMTYGQIATLLGYPRAAQQVGWVLHWADHNAVPYRRVVNRFGQLADGYPQGGRIGHKLELFELDGIEANDQMIIDLRKYLWHPPASKIPKLSTQPLLQDLDFAGVVVQRRTR